MKHNEALLDAMSGIDADIVAASAPGKHQKRRPAWKTFLPTAACFVLAAIIVIAAWRANAPKLTEDGSSQGTPNTEATGSVETYPATQHELAVIPRWEEMSISVQFPEFTVGEIRYTTRVTPIDAARIGDRLGEALSQGYDIYTDTAHEAPLEYYAIRGISTECALAAKFRENEGYYVYVNSWYRPETLEELITALDLRENMTFGNFYSSYFHEDRRHEEVTFHDPDDSIVWEKLLADTSLPNVWDEIGWYGSVFSVSVNIPLLGYENISLWLTEDGHLCTNILDSGKAFFIGEEAVRQFIYYVVTHCTDRTVIVHDYGQMQEEAITTADEDPGIIEMTTQGYNPNQPPEKGEETILTSPAQSSGTVTSPAYRPQFTTSEE